MFKQKSFELKRPIPIAKNWDYRFVLINPVNIQIKGSNHKVLMNNGIIHTKSTAFLQR